MTTPRAQNTMSLHERVLFRKIKEAIAPEHNTFWQQQGNGLLPTGIAKMINICDNGDMSKETLDKVIEVARLQKNAADENSYHYKLYEAIEQAATPIPYATGTDTNSDAFLSQKFNRSSALTTVSYALSEIDKITEYAKTPPAFNRNKPVASEPAATSYNPAIETEALVEKESKVEALDKRAMLLTVIEATMGKENYHKWKAQGGIKGTPKGVSAIQKIILKEITPSSKLNTLDDKKIDEIYDNIESIAKKEIKPLLKLTNQIEQKNLSTLQKLAHKLKSQNEIVLDSQRKLEKLQQKGYTIESTFYIAIIQKNKNLVGNPFKNLPSKAQQLLNAIASGVNSQHWLQKTTFGFNKKVPSGIAQMRKIYNNKKLSDKEKLFYCKKVAEKHYLKANIPELKKFYSNIITATRTLGSLDAEVMGYHSNVEISQDQLEARANTLFQKILPCIEQPLQQQVSHDEKINDTSLRDRPKHIR